VSGIEPHDMDETFLSAYLDDELDAETRAAVAARCGESPMWQAELTNVRAARDAVRSLPVVHAPPGFWDHVLADPDRGTRHRVRMGRWSALAGAAAAAAILGVALVPRPEPVQPSLGTLTQAHAERASLGNDVVSNLAGAVVPVALDR
jgi:anti-sigma factor RsiW